MNFSRVRRRSRVRAVLAGLAGLKLPLIAVPGLQGNLMEIHGGSCSKLWILFEHVTICPLNRTFFLGLLGSSGSFASKSKERSIPKGSDVA